MHEMVLRMPIEMRDRLRAQAKVRGTSLTGLIKQILFDWLERNEGEASVND